MQNKIEKIIALIDILNQKILYRQLWYALWYFGNVTQSLLEPLKNILRHTGYSLKKVAKHNSYFWNKHLCILTLWKIYYYETRANSKD